MKDPVSFELFDGEKLIFSSAGKWLHPLFEVEEFLARSAATVSRESLFLRDKIVGKAAALLIVRLGIPRVHARLISEPGLETLRANGIEITWDALEKRIACATEELLLNETDTEKAYLVLKARAEASKPR